MTALIKKKSGVEMMTIQAKDGTTVLSVAYGTFDKTQLIAGFGLSSSNDYQFTLDNSLGKSFILMGGMSVDRTSGTAVDLIYQWYDETNSQYIGHKAVLRSGTSGNIQTKINPPYRQDAVACILSSDFGGSDIVVSLRVVSVTGSPDYAWTPSGFEDWSGYPVLTVLKT